MLLFMFMMVSMAMRIKARKAKALKPVWGGQLAADLASEVQLLAPVVGKLLEEEIDKEEEGSKDSK